MKYLLLLLFFCGCVTIPKCPSCDCRNSTAKTEWSPEMEECDEWNACTDISD